MAVRAKRVTTSCSFCLKPSDEVAKLVAGPGVYICNECVELSSAIVAEVAEATPDQSGANESRLFRRLSAVA